MDKWGQMEDKWESHLSRQLGGQMGCGSIRHTHMSFCRSRFGMYL